MLICPSECVTLLTPQARVTSSFLASGHQLWEGLHVQPIRGQYLGHVTCIDQWERQKTLPGNKALWWSPEKLPMTRALVTAGAGGDTFYILHRIFTLYVNQQFTRHTIYTIYRDCIGAKVWKVSKLDLHSTIGHTVNENGIDIVVVVAHSLQYRNSTSPNFWSPIRQLGLDFECPVSFPFLKRALKNV